MGLNIVEAGDAAAMIAETTVTAVAGKNYVAGVMGIVANDDAPIEVTVSERGSGVTVLNAVPFPSFTLNLFLARAQPAQPFVTPDVANIGYGQRQTVPVDASQPLLRVQVADDGAPLLVLYRTEGLVRFSDALFVMLLNPDKLGESFLTGRVLNARGT